MLGINQTLVRVKKDAKTVRNKELCPSMARNWPAHSFYNAIYETDGFGFGHFVKRQPLFSN